MDSNKNRILSFLIWYTRDELLEHMMFSLGFYIVLCVCMIPVPIEIFGAGSPEFCIISGLQLIVGIAFVIRYVSLKRNPELKMSSAYLYAGTVFGATSLVLFGSAVQIYFTSVVPFGRAHILANAAGIAPNIFVLTVRIIQYRSKKDHTFGPAYGASFIMPLVIAGKIFIDRSGNDIGKDFLSLVILILGGYLMLCFALIFFINLYVSVKHKTDEYYRSINPPKKKKSR